MQKDTRVVVEELLRLAQEHGAKLAVRVDRERRPVLRKASFDALVAQIFDPFAITVCVYEHAERRAEVVRRLQAAAERAGGVRQNVAVPDVDTYVLLFGRRKFKCYVAGDHERFVTMLDDRMPSCKLCNTSDVELSHSCGAWLCNRCIVELMAKEVVVTRNSNAIDFLCPGCEGKLTATVQPDGRGVEITY